MALLTLYGIDTGIKYDKLYEPGEARAEAFRPRRAVEPARGRRALFQIESGIIASWFQNCGDENATELFPFRWEVVGQAPAEGGARKGQRHRFHQERA